MSALKRNLGLNTTIAIVVGGVIGSGIFMKPALMSSQLGSPLLLLSVWVVAGIITLFGALSNAEVAAMFPETGGQYVFFKKMYGDAFAFLYGWAAFAVFNTAGNASIAYVFSTYANVLVPLPQFGAATTHSIHLHIPFVGDFYPLENFGVKALTIFIILLLTTVNYFSVKQGGALQRVLTSLKVVAIIILIGGLLLSGKGSTANISTNALSMPQGMALISAYMAAIAGAFWAYDGWNNITFIAGEIKNPQTVIPKSLFVGLSFCIIIYALVNLAYVYVLPINKLSASSFVASDAAAVVWGTAGAIVIALMVALSTLGAANASILATSRVTFAMGQESKWFVWAGKVQPKYNTPGNALFLNAAWACVLILSGSFDMLTDMLIFVTWFFYGMSALGVFILRKKMKTFLRSYKVWGYPVVPFIFVVFTFFFLCSTLYTDVVNYNKGTAPVINSVLGIIITCTGIPVYLFSKKKK
jgi:basic amino acid/polyamine antiporter, APA family